MYTVRLQVTLYFPNAFQFNIVQISLDEGSITSVSGNLATSELLLSVKNGVVGLSSLSVGSVVDVSASSMVILEKLSVSSETQTSITSSEGKVFLTFISVGSFFIISYHHQFANTHLRVTNNEAHF